VKNDHQGKWKRSALGKGESGWNLVDAKKTKKKQWENEKVILWKNGKSLQTPKKTFREK